MRGLFRWLDGALADAPDWIAFPVFFGALALVGVGYFLLERRRERKEFERRARESRERTGAPPAG